MPKRTIEEGTLQNFTCPESGKVIGFRFGVRLPRYRGNMVSLINGYYVCVDGEEFPQDKIRFQINGKAPRTFEELKTAVWEHWNYQDTAYLYIEKDIIGKIEDEKILDYKLMIYFCSGTDSEKLEWFKTINIA